MEITAFTNAIIHVPQDVYLHMISDVRKAWMQSMSTSPNGDTITGPHPKEYRLHTTICGNDYTQHSPYDCDPGTMHLICIRTPNEASA